MKRLAMLCLLAFACGSLFAATIKVPTAPTILTIQDAVDSAGDNDIIAISKNPANTEGAYFENVVVPAGLDGLTFTGKVIWDGNVDGISGICLDITGPNAGPILISGITFRNGTIGVRAGNSGATPSVTVTGCRGIGLSAELALLSGDTCTVTKNQLLFCNECVAITGNTAIISGNKVNSCDGDFQITGDTARFEKNAFLNYESGQLCDITGNTAVVISNSLKNGQGDIEVDGVNALISGNKFANTDAQILVGDEATSDGAQILKNSFVDNDDNMIEATGDDMLITGNSGTGCTSIGIDADGADAEISGNKITKGDGGILLDNGNNALITKNKISLSYDGDGIQATGDSIDITSNSISDLADDADGIVLDPDPIGSGGGLIDKNKVTNVSDQGIECSSNNVVISNNSVTAAGQQNEEGFDISGNGCTLTKNKANLCDGDGFRITGSDCDITDCTSTNNGKDGFDCEDIDAGLFNTFTNCKASGNSGEGFDNSTSTGTVVTGGSFTKNRIDMAGNTPNAATITISPETQIGDGSGAATVPEVD